MPVTINGAAITKGTVTFPRERLWSAWLSAVISDASPPPTEGTSVVISDGLVSLKGTVVERTDRSGFAALIVVGGKGKLSTVLAAKHYQQPLKLQVVNDILKECGESLDAASTLAGAFSSFSRRAGYASVQLNETGQPWRVTSAGDVFVGEPTYPAVSTTRQIRELGRSLKTRAYQVAVDGFDLEPGRSYNGQKIQHVEYLLAPKIFRASYHVG